jgi:GNAT superfamily N-acetyltransferase
MAERAPGSVGEVSARVLTPADAAAVARFLLERWESSVFLLSALESAGLGEGRTREHGTWAGVFALPERGAAGGSSAPEGPLLGVAAHLGFGTMTLQCPPALLGPAVRLVAAESGRPVGGFGGPRAQVLAARSALGCDGAPLLFDEPETLLALPLSALRVPEAVRTGALAVRRVPRAEVESLVPWRCDFLVETGLAPPGPHLAENARSILTLSASKDRLFLLEEGGAPQSMCAFNAAAGTVVQIGGVYTPPALRGRGLARAVVAGALLLAQADGADRAVLFTGETNAAALKAYRALGFVDAGDYSLLLFKESYVEPT